MNIYDQFGALPRIRAMTVPLMASEHAALKLASRTEDMAITNLLRCVIVTWLVENGYLAEHRVY